MEETWVFSQSTQEEQWWWDVIMLLQLNSNNQSLHKIVAITLFDVGVSMYQILAIEVSYQLGPNLCHTLLKRHLKFIQE